MTQKDRIYYSGDEILVSLEGFLENLKVLYYDSRYKSLLGEDFINRLRGWEQEIRQRKDDPFTVVVCGDFKRGKSMLINALLKEKVAPVNVTPETVTLNRISYGVHSNEAVLSSSRRLRLSDSELNRSELEAVLSGLDEKVERLELKRDNPLLKKISIIDTPGLGDAMEDYSELVKQSLLQADAVIYVFNVMYPLSMSEQIFLRSAILPQKYTTLFVVGSFTDTIKRKSDYGRICQVIKERMENLMPGTEVLTVSALDELCRINGDERPKTELTEILESRFDDLRKTLDNLISAKADSVIPDRMQRLTAAMTIDLNRELDAIEAGLGMTAEEAAQQREDFRKKKENSTAVQGELLQMIDDQILSFKRETSLWMGEFLDRIAEETQNLAVQPNDVLRRYYEVYCIELLQKALSVCTELHQEQLYDLLDGVSSELGKNLAYNMKTDSRFSFRFQLDNRIWTKGDTASLALNMFDFSGILATAASMAADGIAGLMREKEAEKKKPQLLDKIAAQMNALTISVQKEIETVYNRFGENAKNLILDYYSGRIAADEHALEQAVRSAAKEDEKKEELKGLLKNVRSILNVTSFVQIGTGREVYDE